MKVACTSISVSPPKPSFARAARVQNSRAHLGPLSVDYPENPRQE
jgi:hypothetical protein